MATYVDPRLLKPVSDRLVGAAIEAVDTLVTDDKVASDAAIALTKLGDVDAGTDGLSAGTLQATLQALATRIQALEDAAEA